jgi:flagellar assembly factor FliW
LITIQPGRPTTANLMAPLVVNLASRQAMQALSAEDEYSHQHIFLQPVEETVCS